MPKSKLFLKKNPTLGDFQKYVSAMVKERGFNKESKIVSILKYTRVKTKESAMGQVVRMIFHMRSKLKLKRIFMYLAEKYQ
jgi:pantoate kinase